MTYLSAPILKESIPKQMISIQKKFNDYLRSWTSPTTKYRIAYYKNYQKTIKPGNSNDSRFLYQFVVIENNFEDIKSGYGPDVHDDKLKRRNKMLILTDHKIREESIVAAGGEIYWYQYKYMNWKQKVQFLWHAIKYIQHYEHIYSNDY